MKTRQALLIIVASAPLFFLNLVAQPAGVLYTEHSDFLAMHVPSKYFLIDSWRQTGELPLWNPYTFCGMPFIHDLQVSAFYPPHAVLYLLPAEAVGWALSWLIVLHVVLAGLSMFAYARHAGLDQRAALVSALGYMYAGKWLIHMLKAGHYNMAPLAWLPLVLLLLEQALARRSLLRATWAGAVFALFVLCAYPYVTLYAGMFIALWTLGPVLAEAGYLRDRSDALRAGLAGPLLRWLLFGAWTAAVAIALGAVQLLPGLESAPHATRSLGVEPSTKMLREGMESLLLLVGPALTGTDTWDYEAGLGFLWLALAVLAPVFRSGQVRFQALTAGLLLAYVLVGAFLVQDLPGFKLFRLPARMLLLLGFPIAYLAGVSVQALFAEPGPDEAAIAKGRHVLVRLVFVIGVFQVGYALGRLARDFPLHLHLYWLLLPVTAALAYRIVFVRVDLPAGRRFAGLLALLLIDLWTLTAQNGAGWWAWRDDVATPLVRVLDFDEAFAGSASVNELARLATERPGRVVDRDLPPANFSPLWPGLPPIKRIESAGGFNPTDVRRYKEFLQFVCDRDEPLRPPQGDFTFPVLETFPVKNKALLDVLGVRYVLQPANYSVAGEAVNLADDPRWQAIFADRQPFTFSFTVGGFWELPPYVLYENREVLPRAFVVHQVEPLPAREQLLDRLKTADFRKMAFLEGDFAPLTPVEPATARSVTVNRDEPNRVSLQVGDGPPGQLILGDVWFPGWRCLVNDVETPVLRANYLFRGVAVPAGACSVDFVFEPASYATGQVVSLAALAFVVLLSLLGVLFARKNREQ